MEHYSMNVLQAAQALEVNPEKGLTAAQAQQRLQRHGPNALAEPPKTPMWVRFLMQFKDVMIAILLVAALISLFVSEEGFGFHAEGLADAGIIFAVVLLNAVLGVVQEARAEKALDALKKLSAPNAKVMRDGSRQVVPADSLVPGDVIFVEAGDLVPADARIVQASSLKVEESSLTGESVPVDKHSGELPEGDIPLGDRRNMLFATGIVSYGRGTAIVTHTGMGTQVGRIATMLASEKDEATPLQVKLAKIGKLLGLLALAICAVIFVVGLLEGKPLVEMFMTSVSLAVAAIPEGLPAVVTIVLATGVSRLVKQNAIIRRLPAVETLGCASVICSDKTGTLTQNRMTVVTHYVDDLQKLTGHETGKQADLLRWASLCTDAEITEEDGKQKRVGDPTETALVAAAMAAGMPKPELERAMPRVDELPFDSDRKMMTTVHKVPEGYLSITKGAPDIVLSHCVDDGRLDAAHTANRDMASQALRVLAVAVKRFDAQPEATLELLENGLTFVGLVGMTDPPREEVKDAVGLCAAAGIRPVMITGDHVDTAVAIARELHILRPGDRALTGADLNEMSDEELQRRIGEFSVFARVAPEHKVRIVRAWQRAGEIVAMTGDGVNDAPALKAADIGCAMGITGTDVARGAAHMVLTDDNFATIVVAVREGRGIYGNIMRSIQFLLATNLSEILAILVSVIMKWATPLSAAHLLWVNLVTDSLPALALGVEPVDPGVMKERPRRKDESIFAQGFGLSVLLQGVMVGALVLIAFLLGRALTGVSPADVLREAPDAGITMAFMVMALAELVHAFNLKSKRSLFATGVLNNKFLVGAFFVGLALQLLVALTPLGRSIFGLYELTGQMWAIVAGLALVPVPIMEIYKLIRRVGQQKKA